MLYILDRYENGIAILTNNSPKALGYYADAHLEQLDGVISYDFSVAANHPDAGKLQTEGYVLVRDLDKRLIEFKIKRVEEYHDENGAQYKKVFTENAAISDLRGEIVRPIKLNSVSLSEAMQNALAYTGWQLGDYDDTAPLADYDFTNYPTSLAALQTIRTANSLEIAYRVDFNGAKVLNRYVDIVARRGEDTGKRFEYSRDLVSVNRQEDTTNLVTALVAIGKSNPDGSRVTFTSEEATMNGYYKPAGQDWVGDDDALSQFGRGGKHIYGLYEDTNADNWNALLDGATRQLAQLAQPVLTYDMKLVLLEQLTGVEADKVRIGDGILVVDTTYNPPLHLDARVIELTRSYTDPTQDTATLGQFLELYVDTSATFQKFISAVNQKQGKWDASEVITKDSVEPTEKTDGMLWLDLSVTPNVLKRWDAAKNDWEKATATNFNELNGQVTQTQVSAEAIGSDQLAPGAVQDTHISQGAVTSPAIATGAVDRTHIKDGEITSTKLADSSVDNNALAQESVDATKLKDQAVTAAKLAPNAVTDSAIDAGTITEAKLNWATHLIF